MDITRATTHQHIHIVIIGILRLRMIPDMHTKRVTMTHTDINSII